MKSLLFLLFTVNFVQCRLPQFDNPEVYTPEEDKTYDPENPPGQKITDVKPLGYSTAMLPHPPNVGRPNPVYEVRGLDKRQIELRVETVQKGATICVRDNDEGPDICSQGSINQCYMASKDTLRFEFYCMESCQSSDVTFRFRFVYSKVEADDMWCTMRPTGGYPSDLEDGPPLTYLGKPPVTPAPQKEGGGGGTDSSGSSGRMIYPTLTLMFISLLVFLAF